MQVSMIKGGNPMKFFARHAVAASTLAVTGFSAAQAQPLANMQLDSAT